MRSALALAVALVAVLGCSTSPEGSPADDATNGACPDDADPGSYCNNEGPVFAVQWKCADSTHYRRAKQPTQCTAEPCCPRDCTGWFWNYEDTVEACPSGSICVDVGTLSSPCIAPDAGADAEDASAEAGD